MTIPCFPLFDSRQTAAFATDWMVDVRQDAMPSVRELLGDGAFRMHGLQVEMDVREYKKNGPKRRGDPSGWRAKYTNIVLRRGMFYDRDGQVNDELWRWLQDIVSGRPVARYDGIIEVRNRDATVVATWVFDRGLPARISGPQLNAKPGEIAIEELHIAHEGLRLVRV
jgi:phage tail-like protein